MIRLLYGCFVPALVLSAAVGLAAAPEAPAGQVKPPSLRVMTYNLRFNNPQDGPNAWPNRKAMVASMIRFHLADLVGIQEGLRGQLDELQALLPEFGWYGVGRDDGVDKGEFSAIFYRKDRLKLLEHGTFWLSQTPDVPGSKGWDAAITRIVTWAKFRDKSARRTFIHFNTHFDHMGNIARAESARLLLRRAEEQPSDMPVIVTGDLNATPDSEPYKLLASGSLKDTKQLSLNGHLGPTDTFQGFKTLGTEGPIDHIFVRGPFRVLQHGTLSDTWDGRWPSDHCPVLAELVVPKG
ncbi:MAG TPA: endonuclease/exonuclease/phosphatase family protein [Armatimonadota bacterium]